MAPIPTGPTEIDRKLHRVVLEANPGQFTNLIALARSIEQSRFPEFSYRRSDKTEYTNADTIASYVAFAREIGLLDENLGPTRPKGDVRALASFQQWLSDRVAQYLSDRGSSPGQIGNAVRRLLNANPAELPSQENIRARLSNPPSPTDFRVCLKIMALLRPKVLEVVSRRVVLVPGVFKA
jgi:hypothetical protein